MGENIKWVLVHDNGRQRFYKADRNIEFYKCFGRLMETEGEFNIVCISEALTHVETLCFLGQCVDDKYSIADFTDIAGTMTLMTEGGDVDSIKEDEVYLRQISINNSKGIRENKSCQR